MDREDDLRALDSLPPLSMEGLPTLPTKRKSTRQKKIAWWVGVLSLIFGALFYFLVIVPAFEQYLYMMIVAGVVVVVSIGALFVVTNPIDK